MDKRLKDRGLMKWTGLMFPEHVAMLRQMRGEQDLCEKPIVDDFMRAEFDEGIFYAMEYNLTVRFTTWQAGMIEYVTGFIHYIDHVTEELRIETFSDGFKRVRMADVVRVDVVED
ncbi:YolD-like family protein [Bacillus sp. 03113]|uniref:YolD-like family protein n=1 Tax=Bacillus sp. 03113 TaxID=2578211 RepID=UPI0011432BF0|nr:YolD-like family protein [Bacillus sp. 03113]